MFKQFIGAVCLLWCGCVAAEVVDFYSPATSSVLKNMKQGPVTVAITQGEGSKKPTADGDGLGNIEFYPKNVMSVTVADGHCLKAITIGVSQSALMQPVELTAGSLSGTAEYVWIPDENQAVTSMTLTNGTEDPTGKNRKYTSISVIRVEYDVPDAELMTPEITDDDMTLLDDGTIQLVVNLLSAKHELYYRLSPFSREDIHQGFVQAQGSGTERVITLSDACTVTYYAYDPILMVKGMERTVAVGDDKGSLPVMPRADVQSAVFDLQGRKILAPQRPGIYIVNGRKMFIGR